MRRRLQIKNVYGNDKINDDVERLREERRKELKEIRRSYAEKKDHNDWNENESIKNAKPITKTVKLRSKSMHISGNFDDFWVREASKEKDNADRYINPPQGQQSNLRLAQKHLDLAEKHWRKWEGIAQSAMNELPEGAGYNEAVTAWEVTQTANATWIQTAQNTIELTY